MSQAKTPMSKSFHIGGKFVADGCTLWQKTLSGVVGFLLSRDIDFIPA